MEADSRRYNHPLLSTAIMEAEALNQIEFRLADLDTRATQLRGFL
jgi:hypothetical protein